MSVGGPSILLPPRSRGNEPALGALTIALTPYYQQSCVNPSRQWELVNPPINLGGIQASLVPIDNKIVVNPPEESDFHICQSVQPDRNPLPRNDLRRFRLKKKVPAVNFRWTQKFSPRQDARSCHKIP